MKKGIYVLFEGANGSGKSTQAKRLFEHIKNSGLPVILNTQPTKKSASEVSDGFSKTSANAFGIVIRELIEGRCPDEDLMYEYSLKFKELREITMNESLREEDVEILGDFFDALSSAYDMITSGKKIKLNERILQALYCADGLFDFKETVIPAIENGISVIQDRDRISSFVHGDASGNFPFLENLKIHQIVLGNYYIKPDVTFFFDASVETCVKRLSSSGKVLDIYETEETLKKIIESYKKVFDFFKEYPDVGYKNIYTINAAEDRNAIFEKVLKQWENI